MTPDFRVFSNLDDFKRLASLVGEIVIAWGAADAVPSLLMNMLHETHGAS